MTPMKSKPKRPDQNDMKYFSYAMSIGRDIGRDRYHADLKKYADEMDEWLKKCVLPTLKWNRNRLRQDIAGWFDGLKPSLDLTFYHTLSYNGDIKVGEMMKQKEIELDVLIVELKEL